VSLSAMLERSSEPCSNCTYWPEISSHSSREMAIWNETIAHL